MKFSDIPISLQEYTSGDEEWSHEDGSIGIKWIGRYNFTIDLAHQKLYLEPRTSSL